MSETMNLVEATEWSEKTGREVITVNGRVAICSACRLKWVNDNSPVISHSYPLYGWKKTEKWKCINHDQAMSCLALGHKVQAMAANGKWWNVKLGDDHKVVSDNQLNRSLLLLSNRKWRVLK